MIKKQRNKERLLDLLGVLLLLIEHANDEEEREFFQSIADKIENKIKEIDK